MAEITYKISGTANTAPIITAQNALNAVADSGAGVQDTMMGLQAASTGSATGVFYLAKSVRALWTTFKAGQMAVPILAAAAAAIWAISKAWSWYKGRQDEATKATSEAAQKTDAFIQRLRQLRTAQNDITWNAQIKSLNDLASAYANAQKSADALTASQAEARSIAGAKEVSDVQADYTRRMRKATSPEDEAQIKANMQREMAAADYAAKYKEFQAQAALTGEAQTAKKQQRNALVAQQIIAEQGTPVKKSSAKISGLESTLSGMRDQFGSDKYKAVCDELVKARDHHVKLIEQQHKQLDSVNKQLAASKAEIMLLGEKDRRIKESLAALAAEAAAKSEILSLEEKHAAIQRSQADAQKIQQARQKSIADAEKKSAQELATKKAAAAAAEEASAKRLAGLKEFQAKAQGVADEATRRVMDPAYAHQQKIDAREAAREEKRFESKYQRALRAQARGGHLTKDTQDILAAGAARNLAGKAEASIAKLTGDTANNTKVIAEKVKELITKLDELLTMK